MSCQVEFSDEFGVWFEKELSGAEQASVARVVDMLVEAGTKLPFPYSSGISGSRFPHMRELRIQHQGRPYRVLYAFDPRRNAMLLIGGDKTGNNNWYREIIPVADKIYEQHLKQLERESA